MMDSPNETLPQRYAAAIGMFDGVHRGHRHLLECVREEALRRGLRPAVVTFAAHPSEVTTPDCPVSMLTGVEERTALLRGEGIERVIMLDFDERLRALTSADFIRMLHDSYGVDCLVVGFNNRFGSDRNHDFYDYCREGREIGVELVRATEVEGEKSSSSIIRRYLSSGQVEAAARCLGRNFTLKGTVVRGRQLGRTIGFPTANIKPSLRRAQLPGAGVYAVMVTVPSMNCGRLPAMVNIGWRPTVNDDMSDVTIEAHIFGFDADIYGRELELEFVGRVRDERRFDSVDELKEQLGRDAEAVRRMLS